jgi:hypothetical protein
MLHISRALFPARILLIAQGIYFALTGAWPLLHLPSFLAVTGPKTDLWLVQTVGALLLVMGAVMILAGLRKPTLEVLLLAVAGAAALAAIDILFVCQRVISPIYLLDAAAQATILAAWLAVALFHRHAARHVPPTGRDRFAGHLAIVPQS